MRVLNWGGGEDTLWVSVSQRRNENTGVTHIAHLKTHQGTADKSILSPIHFTLWRRQGEKVNKPATPGLLKISFIYTNCKLFSVDFVISGVREGTFFYQPSKSSETLLNKAHYTNRSAPKLC